jgi:phosphoglycerate dehydrogenase-like enzyme
VPANRDRDHSPAGAGPDHDGAAAHPPAVTPPTALRVAIGPEPDSFAVDAVVAGGGQVVALGDPADALVWLSPRRRDNDVLRRTLDAEPSIRWIQLPFAGVEKVVADGIIDDERAWTCAKGSYAEPVAEHALMLALAGLRRLPTRIRATTWGEQAGTSLFDAPVTILGGGGITRELIRLLTPLRAEITVVRRHADPVAGAARTVTTDSLHDVLPDAVVVFLALALTPATERVIGRPELERMDGRAWLVNVARGRHVDTDALVAALGAGEIGGAALDVTDPEPLPDGHPLWTAPNCIITPHSADTWDMVRPLLAARIRENVARYRAGEPLCGLVDPAAGY